MESSIYYGPDIKGGQLKQYTVFNNGLPDYVKKLIKEKPKIANAIVGISDFPNVFKKLKDKTSPEAVIYQALKGE